MERIFLVLCLALFCAGWAYADNCYYSQNWTYRKSNPEFSCPPGFKEFTHTQVFDITICKSPDVPGAEHQLINVCNVIRDGVDACIIRVSKKWDFCWDVEED